jgi:hypothetical protein
MSKLDENVSVLRVEDDFFELAGAFRKQFEDKILNSAQEEAGVTPLQYAFSKDRYQFLTISAARMFTPDLLESFTDRLRLWGNQLLKASHVHVSTPQLRVFYTGSRRNLLKDEVNAVWHFGLSLTRRDGRGKGRIRVLESIFPEDCAAPFAMHDFTTVELDFNRLFVHSTLHPYSIEPASGSSTILDATVLLDGYLW